MDLSTNKTTDSLQRGIRTPQYSESRLLDAFDVKMQTSYAIHWSCDIQSIGKSSDNESVDT
jgi:hypothetical protein